MSFSKHLRVRRDIDPLHLYRPIDSAQWTTLVSGDVSVLKDNGRGPTLDLTQSTAANRPGQGVDALGNSFMSFTQSNPNEQSLVGAAAADWRFLVDVPDGGGVTIAFTVEVTDITANNVIFETLDDGNDIGVFGRINGASGSGCYTHLGTGGGNLSVDLQSGGPNQSALIGPAGVYTYVARYRDINDVGPIKDPENKREAELSLAGQVLMVNQPRPGEFLAADPTRAIRIGAHTTVANLGLRGNISEFFFDDRYLSDELTRRYHQRGVDQFGAFKGILT